jgi:hypothetical protein
MRPAAAVFVFVPLLLPLLLLLLALPVPSLLLPVVVRLPLCGCCSSAYEYLPPR